jgi:hypothetical protein
MAAFLIVNLAGLIAISILLAHYWWEKRILSGFVHSNVPPSESTFATARDLAGLIHAQISRGGERPFIPIRALDILGATPVSILRRGGCCSGLTRLYITGLGTLGIKAAQVTLYHAAGQAQHCLAEVSLGERRVLVDPLYGFYYVDIHGRHISLDALRRGIKPQYRRLPHSADETYPANDYYNFTFSRTKTANWTKTWVRRSAYRILRVLTAGRIDTLRQPLWMEWPQVVVSVAVTWGVVMFDLASDTPEPVFAPPFYAMFIALCLILLRSGNVSRRQQPTRSAGRSVRD